MIHDVVGFFNGLPRVPPVELRVCTAVLEVLAIP